jgi:hypothetical protein
MNAITHHDTGYAQAMGRLLMLYTQVDQFIMEACAERIARAPHRAAKLGLAKQVGDECRHVTIQNQWMAQFGVDLRPAVEPAALDALHEHFRGLDWIDFLTDLYLVIEALGSQAVEQVVPLADPGTRKSLHVPLRDEIDHVAFGLTELKAAISSLDEQQRRTVLDRVPERMDAMIERLLALDVPVMEWFAQVGCDNGQLLDVLGRRKAELVGAVARAA